MVKWEVQKTYQMASMPKMVDSTALSVVVGIEIDIPKGCSKKKEDIIDHLMVMEIKRVVWVYF